MTEVAETLVAGAYAAAAKLADMLVAGNVNEGIGKAIRALTPADARQAQTDRVCQAISDFCLLTAKRIGMELDAAKHETFGDAIQAAIASAEADQRTTTLEEAAEWFIQERLNWHKESGIPPQPGTERGCSCYGDDKTNSHGSGCPRRIAAKILALKGKG